MSDLNPGKYLFGKAVCSAALIVIVMLVLSGCQVYRPAAEESYVDGAAIISLSSNASFSYRFLDRSISGSGFLVYQKPDKMRMVLLSPFGSVLQEVFVSADIATIIDPGNGIAFRGSIDELPDKGNFSAWRYIHWIIDIDPPESPRITKSIERMNRFGDFELASFAKGVLTSKTTAKGGRVSYDKYIAAHGVAMPLEIIYETAANEKFSILFEDPEINVPLADETFKPNLNKFAVYPLSDLK